MQQGVAMPMNTCHDGWHRIESGLDEASSSCSSCSGKSMVTDLGPWALLRPPKTSSVVLVMPEAPKKIIEKFNE